MTQIKIRIYDPRHPWLKVLHLIGNLGFDEEFQQGQRLLPSQITRLGRDHCWDALLDDVQFSSDRYLFQLDRRMHLTGHIRIVEAIGLAQALVRLELEILTTERMTPATRKVRERHLVCAANLRLKMMDLARESIWRKPFADCGRIDKCAVDSLRRRREHSMKFDRVRIICCHDFAPLMLSRMATAEIDTRHSRG